MESNSKSQPDEEAQVILSALKRSWKAIIGLTLLLVVVILVFKLVLVPWRSSISDSGGNPQSYTNRVMINRLSNQLGLSTDQALAVFKLYRKWKAKSIVLTMQYDSLNTVFNQKRLANDSVTNDGILLKLIDYELQMNENTTAFYNSLQGILTREQSTKFLRLVRGEQ